MSIKCIRNTFNSGFRFGCHPQDLIIYALKSSHRVSTPNHKHLGEQHIIVGISAKEGGCPDSCPTFPCLGFLLTSVIQKFHARLQTYRNVWWSRQKSSRRMTNEPFSEREKKQQETGRPHLDPTTSLCQRAKKDSI